MGSIESHATERCVLVRAGNAAEGSTGVTYAPGISTASAGAEGLCLQLAGLQPGARSRAHQHIAGSVPHLVLNPSDTEPAVAVLARTDPRAQEDVTALPHLDDAAHLRPQS